MMKGLSVKEIELVSWLEFHKKYFFISADVDMLTKNKTQRYNLIKNLVRKKRIVKLNKTKYYLIPVKAKSGSWVEHPFIIADEICDGKNYFIGGWAASQYWGLTEQIPQQIDIFTTRRQGEKKVLNTRCIFHRTSQKKSEKTVPQIIDGHRFLIQPKEEVKKCLKSIEGQYFFCSFACNVFLN